MFSCWTFLFRRCPFVLASKGIFNQSFFTSPKWFQLGRLQPPWEKNNLSIKKKQKLPIPFIVIKKSVTNPISKRYKVQLLRCTPSRILWLLSGEVWTLQECMLFGDHLWTQLFGVEPIAHGNQYGIWSSYCIYSPRNKPWEYKPKRTKGLLFFCVGGGGGKKLSWRRISI